MDIDRLANRYERDGVIKVEGLMSRESVASLREAIDVYSNTHLSTLPPEDYVLEADGESVRNFWRMNKHDAFFDELARNSDIVALVKRLVHDEPVLMGVESFNKPARIGSAVPPHQDNAYFCMTPPDVLTVWIAVDDVTEENGPVCYVPGSHLEGLLPHAPSGVAGNSMGISDPKQFEETYTGLLSPGDALIHHSEIIHFSAPNHSDRSRLGLLLVYRAAHCKKNPALEKAYALAQ